MVEVETSLEVGLRDQRRQGSFLRKDNCTSPSHDYWDFGQDPEDISPVPVSLVVTVVSSFCFYSRSPRSQVSCRSVLKSLGTVNECIRTVGPGHFRLIQDTLWLH